MYCLSPDSARGKTRETPGFLAAQRARSRQLTIFELSGHVG